MTAPVANVSVKIVPPASAPARAALREYFADIASRYQGRPITEPELHQVLTENPSDDLAPPTGLFLVAFGDSGPIGCVGLRLLPAGLGEVTRVYVADGARRGGLGGRLLAEVESAALANGRTALRLDVRGDLVEARRLYARHGYREVPAFNDSPYAAHWFAKDLIATRRLAAHTASAQAAKTAPRMLEPVHPAQANTVVVVVAPRAEPSE